MNDESIREALDRHGLLARKSLGQHFLLDLNLTRKIARAAGDISGKAVLEIGPGPGGLTRALLEAGADPLIAIERDARFLPLLEEMSAAHGGRLRIVHADALAVDEAALLGVNAEAPVPVVSNLPYNVGTPLLVKWLKAGPWRGPMTLMFQKEVAERAAAQAGSAAYGRLAVLCQARCTARIVLDVPARAFTPPPKVASAVVRLVDNPSPYADLAALETVTAAAFGQRRKMLRSALRSLGPLGGDAVLEAAGIAPEARAETVPPEGFFRMADAWRTLYGGAR